MSLNIPSTAKARIGTIAAAAAVTLSLTGGFTVAQAATAAPADAAVFYIEPDAGRVYVSNFGTKITGTGRTHIYGWPGREYIETQCIMQQFLGYGDNRKWVSEWSNPGGYSRTGGRTSCSWTQPKAPGTYRMLVGSHTRTLVDADKWIWDTGPVFTVSHSGSW